ncbi:MAG: NAD(P)/FAD-dependent oxidoreductase [Pseudomonadota bacterium]|nr:NAD(P)/FAD-dependent oxidoreductase [Pseudomonadota bacterium]
MATDKHIFDVIIIGAGAAGLFCAAQAGARGKQVALIDHRTKIAEKIRISGGGRCNFTNIYCDADNFISQNPHFVKSALSAYSPYDFIDLVSRYKIAFHEKKLGQLFCDDSSQQIIDMLMAECRQAKVQNYFGQKVLGVQKTESGFEVTAENTRFEADRLVIATGGLSIPKIGATGFGYEIAEQFNLKIVTPQAGLVPLTFTDRMKTFCQSLSGLSVAAELFNNRASFAEGLLFTHRGLSGPSILQISSYWLEGETVCVNLMPQTDMAALLISEKRQSARTEIQTCLAKFLPKRLAGDLCELQDMRGRLSDMADTKLANFGQMINGWQVKPNGSEGYRTAEVTLGGVSTDMLSSKDMQAKSVPGLYFIGEVVDVTGHLGGHNFQWAWASAYAAATHF